MTRPNAPASTPVPDISQSGDRDGTPRGDIVGRAGEVWHGLAKHIRPPERRATIRVLLVALVVAVICWYFGADAWHSIVIGIALTTVGVTAWAGTAGPAPRNTDWRGDDRPKWNGARRDIAELSVSLRGRHGRGITAAWRVKRLARQRLALHQLDLDDPADRRQIVQLIGRRTYVILVRGERRPLRLRSLLYCLDVLDALDPARSAAPPSRSRRRTPIFARQRPRRARER